ncbi:MAG: hypothetical protein KDA57_00475 [Planctomycetales bacterium]|nr:hypothetical protein [Planctomycetales bacterium]
MEGTQNSFLRKAALRIAIVLLAFFTGSLVCAEQFDLEQEVDRIRQIVLSRGSEPNALATLVQLSRELPPAATARLFSQMAEEYLHAGHLDLAGEVLRHLVENHSEQPMAVDGLISLVQLYSSSEVAHANQRASHAEDGSNLPVYALFLAEQALQKQPHWAENPALAFQCAVATRLSGNAQTAKSWLSPLKHNRRLQPWHDYARVEAWLSTAREQGTLLPAAQCAYSDERPLLDGVLDEQMWQVALPLELATNNRSTQPTGATQIRLARDDEHLYLAIHCQKNAQVEYPEDQLPRTYDAELSGHDRVRLSLDLDRDYATCYHLSVDHRGQTADSCWHDTTWNPRWYVAARSDETAWTIEAAIPWNELTNHPPGPLDAWALAAERDLPTSSSLSQPLAREKATDYRAEQFSLLLFD